MTSPESVDYGAIYDTIATLMSGDTPKDLNRASCKKIMAIMAQLLHEMRNRKEEVNDARNCLENFKIPDEDATAQTSDICVRGLNVLCLPNNLFMKQNKN
jgi:hypothetical protein